MKKNKKHRFSLVELICLIIIVGLIVIMSIFTVLKTLEKNHRDTKLSQEELLINACERYIAKNQDIAPKVIGDSINVDLSTLKNMNYLSENKYDFIKTACFKNSYVRVYKLNQNEYSYLPYLHCDNKTYVEKLPSPEINILFIDSKEENNNSLIFNNINESRIYIDMIGGEDSFGREIELYTYEIVIYMRTKTNSNLVEKYSSGIIDANRNYTSTIDKKIMSYFNAKDATEIKVVVRATNVLGGVSEVASFAQSKINNNGN